MSRRADFPRSSLAEGLAFTALVALPNVAQGLFRRRHRVVAALDRFGVNAGGHRLLASLQRRYGDGPMWVPVGQQPILVVFGPEQIRFALSNAPDPLASDREPKRSGLLFQRHALTISRDPDWSDRRRFTEAVLGRARSDPAIQSLFTAIAAEEAAALPEEMSWTNFNGVLRRLARRIILGQSASGDDQISEQLATLMAKANPPGKGDPELYREFVTTLERYVAIGEEASLVGLFDGAPMTEITDPAGQIIHWMFAVGDPLAISTRQCLALLATHGDILAKVHRELDELHDTTYLAACLQEAMRLWPTTPVLARTIIRDMDWDGVQVPAGTSVTIVNAFNHRDTARFAYADRFEPTVWLNGCAARSWSFNYFSHGPQVCPGADLVVLLGTTFLAAVLRTAEPVASAVSLHPGAPLPRTFHYSRCRIRLRLRTPRRRDRNGRRTRFRETQLRTHGTWR